MALLTPMGFASAQPVDGPLVDTTCSYPQIEAALRVEAPDLADRLAQNPEAQGKLQKFAAASVDERRQRLQELRDRNPDVSAKFEEKRNSPRGQERIAQLTRVANTCSNY